MRALWPSSCAILLALLGVVRLSAQSDSEPIGIVSRLKGDWTLVREQRILAAGDEVFSNNTVRSDPSTSNEIRIALFDGSVWSKVCTTQEPCEGSYRIPTPAAQERSLLGFLKTYFTARNRIPVIFTASRAVGARGPHEAVLVATDGMIELTPALEGTPPGRWQVTLSDPSKARETGVTQTLDWPHDTMLRIGNLPDSVYALDVQSESGETFGPPSAALLTSPQLAETARNEFEEARKLTARWTEVDGATVRAFLVKALYAIQMSTHP